jgi:hypothetical protein
MFTCFINIKTLLLHLTHTNHLESPIKEMESNFSVNHLKLFSYIQFLC